MSHLALGGVPSERRVTRRVLAGLLLGLGRLGGGRVWGCLVHDLNERLLLQQVGAALNDVLDRKLHLVWSANLIAMAVVMVKNDPLVVLASGQACKSSSA